MNNYYITVKLSDNYLYNDTIYNGTMTIAMQCCALIAGIIHIFIFLMESCWFMRPYIYKRFGAKNLEGAKARQLFAFNQGFYNLFLAIGVLLGLVLLRVGHNPVVAETLILFSCASMTGAALVLMLSGGRNMLLATIIQGLPPGLAWLFYSLI